MLMIALLKVQSQMLTSPASASLNNCSIPVIDFDGIIMSNLICMQTEDESIGSGHRTMKKKSFLIEGVLMCLIPQIVKFPTYNCCNQITQGESFTLMTY